MTKIADDAESISRRLKELEAERNEAMTGSSAPAAEQEKDDTPSGYGDYMVWSQPITGYKLRSQAHPGWPYAGTGFEWRRFVRS